MCTFLISHILIAIGDLSGNAVIVMIHNIVVLGAVGRCSHTVPIFIPKHSSAQHRFKSKAWIIL